jgi:hypothetical protein
MSIMATLFIRENSHSRRRPNRRIFFPDSLPDLERAAAPARRSAGRSGFCKDSQGVDRRGPISVCAPDAGGIALTRCPQGWPPLDLRPKVHKKSMWVDELSYMKKIKNVPIRSCLVCTLMRQLAIGRESRLIEALKRLRGRWRPSPALAAHEVVVPIRSARSGPSRRQRHSSCREGQGRWDCH